MATSNIDLEDPLEVGFMNFKQGMLSGLAECDVQCCYDSTTLWNNFIRCKKNPGHFQFIPVPHFGMGHLPSHCRDPRIVAYIKQASRFTVRLLTRYVSQDRPAYYPCGNMRGKKVLRLASGFAWVAGETQEFPCPIEACPYGKHKHNVYGYIRIITSRHVVCDLKEALHTQGQFYFDSPSHVGTTVLAQCVGLEYNLEDTDIAHLRCVTHDPNLCHILQVDMDLLRDIYNAVPIDLWRQCRDLCVVISHPHGMSKTISVGKHVTFAVTMSRSHAHYHRSPTCPGCSGAPVFYVSPREKGGHPMWVPAIHSFHCLQSRLNCAFK